MPPIRVAQQARPAPAEPPAHRFAFPKDHHLIVTTQQNVLSWDARGLTKAFTSGSGGIHAAKEAKDGSNLLAIADSQVVLLHDTNRGMEKSYRLKGTDGQIRLLEYSDDSKSLFFTTTLQNAVQSYSLRRSCLLEPAHMHPSPPTVLATSNTSHLLLSASENPPTIYLQNLTLRTPPVLIQPRASSSAAVTASFHPERPNVFLIAFKDGTLAAYDATRILGKSARGGQGGEIGHFNELHNVVNISMASSAEEENGYSESIGTVSIGSVAVGITGAAFLPGHRSRAVSVGGDGRCRIVDFDSGANILRTWHAKAPATSLSVLPLPTAKTAGFRRRLAQASKSATEQSEAGSNGSANYIIAVGRQDGKVLLFDPVGLLLKEQTVDAEAGQVIDIEWMKGPGLKPASKSRQNSPVKTRPESKTGKSAIPKDPPKKKSRKSVDFAVEAQTDDEETAASQDVSESEAMSTGEPEMTEDEDTGTVKHVFAEDSGTVNVSRAPAAGLAPQDIEAIAATNFMDLFSPVKQPAPQRRSPRARLRPRILSTTFKDNGTSGPSSSPSKIPQLSAVIPSLPHPKAQENPAAPEGDIGQLQHGSMRGFIPDALAQQASSTRSASPEHPTQEIRIAKTPNSRTPRARKNRRVSNNVRMPSSSSANPSVSSKILSDIRRIGETGSGKKSGLAILAPYMNPKSTPRAGAAKSPAVAAQPQKASAPAPVPEPVPTPAFEDVKSPASIPLSDDIWLTSDDEAGAPHRRSRQTSQRRRGASPDADADVAMRSPRGLEPGSALSPEGPVDVEEYFPRSSSLVPGAGKRRVRGKSGISAGAEGEECECGSACCKVLRGEVRSMSEELRALREQMAEMKALVVGRV